MTKSINELISRAEAIIIENNESTKQRKKLEGMVHEVSELMVAETENLDLCVRAANLLSRVADEKVDSVLAKVTTVINRALSILFPEETRTVSIEKTMYRDTHPHFNVILKTETGENRSFVQSGSGLAQVVSFLFTVCLIDMIGGRKILVMDEILNGLHPRAKRQVADILKAMEGKFQFIMTEYQLDVGKQYEVVKTGGTAEVLEYGTGMYYYDVSQEGRDSEIAS